MRFAIITWNDAFGDSHSEATADTVQDQHKPILMETAGWVLRDDDVGISVFPERALETNSYRGRTFIPRGMVVSVRDILLDPPTRKKRVKKAPPVVPPTVSPA